MKIGIVCPYSFDFPGGVMQHILGLSKALENKKHNVKILAPGEKQQTIKNVQTVGKSIEIPINGSVARMKFSPAASDSVQKWIGDNNFDLIHIHEPISPSVSILALWYAKCPIVGTFHAYYKKNAISQLAGFTLKKSISKISKSIAVSNQAALTVSENFKLDPIIIPNGINMSDFIPSDSADSNSALFLGRVNEKRKGLDIVLKSWKLVTKANKNIKLKIAGSGKLSFEQMRIIEKYSDSIEFIGGVDDEQKKQLLSESFVYIAPQLFGESFGIVLLEAFASKTPVIASSIQAFVDLSEGGRYSIIFSNKNYKHLAQKILNTFSNREKSKILSNDAYEFCRQFDWEIISERILKVYEQCL